MSIMQAVGTPIHQLEDVKGRLIAHALINGVGDAAVASARLQAHAQVISLTHPSRGRQQAHPVQLWSLESICQLSPQACVVLLKTYVLSMPVPLIASRSMAAQAT